MKFCKLENCKVKDTYIREHCFYEYREHKCWRGWLDAFMLIIALRFRKEYKQ